MKIIALAGYAGTGKTTVARELSLTLQEHVTITSFADPVKKTALRLGWDGRKDPRGRELLVTIGMAGRAYKEDMWICRWWDHVRTLDSDIVIVDDLRFKNEAEFIRSLGGEVVFLRRQGFTPGANAAELFEPEWADRIIDIINDDVEGTAALVSQ